MGGLDRMVVLYSRVCTAPIVFFEMVCQFAICSSQSSRPTSQINHRSGYRCSLCEITLLGTGVCTIGGSGQIKRNWDLEQNRDTTGTQRRHIFFFDHNSRNTYLCSAHVFSRIDHGTKKCTRSSSIVIDFATDHG